MTDISTIGPKELIHDVRTDLVEGAGTVLEGTGQGAGLVPAAGAAQDTRVRAGKGRGRGRGKGRNNQLTLLLLKAYIYRHLAKSMFWQNLTFQSTCI